MSCLIDLYYTFHQIKSLWLCLWVLVFESGNDVFSSYREEIRTRVPHVRSAEVHNRSSGSLCASVRERVCVCMLCFSIGWQMILRPGCGVLSSSQEWKYFPVQDETTVPVKVLPRRDHVETACREIYCFLLPQSYKSWTVNNGACTICKLGLWEKEKIRNTRQKWKHRLSSIFCGVCQSAL